MRRQAIVVGALAATMLAGSAVPAPAATPPSKEVAKLRREVARLKAQNRDLRRSLRTAISERDRLQREKASLTAERDDARAQATDLTGQVATLTNERDTARQQLATAQRGIGGLISTMAPVDIWNLAFPAVAAVFRSDRWHTSYYSLGSYTFTCCGFCSG